MSADLFEEDLWHAPSLTAPYSAGAPTPVYRMDSAGNVHLRGAATRGGASSGAVLFTLPADYRPTITVRLTLGCLPSAATARMVITTGGDVALFEVAGTVTDYYIDAVFSAL